MRNLSPRIGFDRFIDVRWLTLALNLRTGLADADDLNELLIRDMSGIAARKKTRTLLNRLWLEPRPHLTDFADRGVEVFRKQGETIVPLLSWGMAIATYPFFGQVAELVGRLSTIQGDCTSAEVHRRMSEVYGEREGTYRMTNMVLQSQANWGVIKRVDSGKRLVRCAATALTNESAIAWLLEAVLRYKMKPVPLVTLQSMSVIFPFYFEQSVAYIASRSPHFELGTEGSNDRVVALPAAL
jgi:hypothetical protein